MGEAALVQAEPPPADRIVLFSAIDRRGRATAEQMFNPRAIETAKAICEAAGRIPGALRVVDLPAEGWPAQVLHAQSQERVALVGTEPPSERLAPALAEALKELRAAGWLPFGAIEDAAQRAAERAAQDLAARNERANRQDAPVSEPTEEADPS